MILKSFIQIAEALMRKPAQSKKVKRTWVYMAHPADCGLPPCACGNTGVVWSEWKNHLWCALCEIDFIPEHGGIFDGPIPVAMTAMMGIDLRRVSLRTKKIMKEKE